MCLYVFLVCLFFVCLFVLVFLLFRLPISAFKNRAIVLMLDSCLLLFFFKRQEIHMNIYIYKMNFLLSTGISSNLLGCKVMVNGVTSTECAS